MKKNIFRIKNSISAVLVVFSLIICGCGTGGGSSNAATPQVGIPVNDSINSTVKKTIVPTEKTSSSGYQPNAIENYVNNGYGKWTYKAGNSYVKRTDIMSSSYSPSAKNELELLKFFAITDVHVADIQSPAQLLNFGLQISSSGLSFYSPSISYSMQFFDATIKTVNTLHKSKNFDFGLFIGDAVNIGQYNELRWYIDIIDGKVINPNSDPLSTSVSDYVMPFKAAGLDRGIKWYQALGNHDHFWQGTYNSTQSISNIATGEYLRDLSSIFFDVLISVSYYIGRIDVNSAYGNVESYSIFNPPRVNTNPNRKLTQRREWLNEFNNTESSPYGHGFYPQSAISDPTLSACYSFEPKGSNLPIKVIVLDDTEDEPLSGFVAYNGYIDLKRFEWLKKELQEGQTNGKLMIIAAHIPIGVDPFLWDRSSNPSESQIITELKKYPNLILWASGHRHLNTITPMASTDVNHPENGFWVVETASLKDFPQQFRLFDILLNSDNTVSIFATNIDPVLEPGTIAEKSRTLSVAFFQLFNGTNYLTSNPSGSYNAELIKQLSPEMQIKLAKYK